MFACFVWAFAMSATEPTEACGWDGFVRETLADLEAELRKSETGMLPPRRVARSPKGLLSPLVMVSGSEAAEAAHVPWQNIFRNHNRLVSDAWPTADALEVHPGLFRREWSKATIELDCKSLRSSFTFHTDSRGSGGGA